MVIVPFQDRGRGIETERHTTTFFYEQKGSLKTTQKFLGILTLRKCSLRRNSLL